MISLRILQNLKKANDMANIKEIDHTERTEPVDEGKIRQFAITEK